MHNSYVRVGHIWTIGTDVLDTEFAAFDIAQYKSINGDDGGTWSPAAVLYVLGQGLGFNLPAASDATAPWPLFGNDGTGRTRSYVASLANAFKQVNFAPNSQGNQVASAPAGTLQTLVTPHDAARLSSVKLYFKFSTGRGSLPTTFPKLSVYRVPLLTGAAGVALLSTDPGTGLAITAAGTVGAYEASGAVQNFTYNCDQNWDIDRTQYAYCVQVTDETGGGAQAGNMYMGVVLNFTRIADMRFA